MKIPQVCIELQLEQSSLLVSFKVNCSGNSIYKLVSTMWVTYSEVASNYITHFNQIIGSLKFSARNVPDTGHSTGHAKTDCLINSLCPSRL